MRSRAEQVVALLEKWAEDQSWGDDKRGQFDVVVAAIRELGKVPVTSLDVQLLRDLADMTPRSAMHQEERDQLHDLAARLEGAVGESTQSSTQREENAR
jgi:hypothetical protein